MADKTPQKSSRKLPATPSLTYSPSTASPATPVTPGPPTETPTLGIARSRSQLDFAPSKSKGKVNGIFDKRDQKKTSSTAEGEDVGFPVPPWDRSVEVVWTRRIATSDNKQRDDELSFHFNIVRLAAETAKIRPAVIDPTALTRERRVLTAAPREGSSLPSQRRDIAGKDNGPYFKLPDRVRFNITQLVVNSHNSGKPIRLNTPSYLSPIWPVNKLSNAELKEWSTDYFDSLDNALRELEKYTTVCFAMRVDFLTTMFLTRRFHVVYSPLVTETLQRAATLYMERYGHLMKWINVEIDLTKMAGNFHPAAMDLSMETSLQRIRQSIDRFTTSQLTRHEGSRIQSLVILVRRYYGYRPGTKHLVAEKAPSSEERRGSSSEGDVYKNTKGEEAGNARAQSSSRAEQSESRPDNGDRSRRDRPGENADPEKSDSGGEEEDSPRQEENIKGKEKETAPVTPVTASTAADVTKDVRKEKGKEKVDKGKGPGKYVPPTPTENIPKWLPHGAISSYPAKLPKGIPYISDEYLSILDPFKRLGPFLNNLCIVGTNMQYTKELIDAIWGEDRPKSKKEAGVLCHYRTPSRVYPTTPGQRSVVNNGSGHGGIQLIQHETDPHKWTGLYGCSPTQHWEKYGIGLFNFKPTQIPRPPGPLTLSATPPHLPGNSLDLQSESSSSTFTRIRKCRSIASFTNASRGGGGGGGGSSRLCRRFSTTSLFNLLTRLGTYREPDTNTNSAGSALGGYGSDTSPGAGVGSSSSRPNSSMYRTSSAESECGAAAAAAVVAAAVVPEEAAAASSSLAPPPAAPPDDKIRERTKRSTLFLASRIPVLVKKHGGRFGFSPTKRDKLPPVPISLSYETGTLVKGRRGLRSLGGLFGGAGGSSSSARGGSGGVGTSAGTSAAGRGGGTGRGASSSGSVRGSGGKGRGGAAMTPATRGTSRGRSTVGGSLRGRGSVRGTSRGRTTLGGTSRGGGSVRGTIRGRMALGGTSRGRVTLEGTSRGRASVRGTHTGTSMGIGTGKGKEKPT